MNGKKNELLPEMVEIESFKFSARLNVVSSFSQFFRAANNELSVIRLGEKIVYSSNVQEEIFTRILEIVGREIDEKYENPFDTPLAIYLFVLNDTKYEERAAKIVLDTKNCFYAEKLAQKILRSKYLKWDDCSKGTWNTVRTNTERGLVDRENLGNRSYHSDVEGFKGDPIEHARQEALDIVFYLHKSRDLLMEAIDVIDDLVSGEGLHAYQAKERAWKFLDDVKPRLYPDAKE